MDDEQSAALVGNGRFEVGSVPASGSAVTTPTLAALMALQKPARRSIWSALAWELEVPLAHALASRPPAGSPRRLNLGCGEMRPAGWLNADFATWRWRLQRRRQPDWNLDATRPWPCETGYFEVIHFEHTLEHFPYDIGIAVLRECRRCLRASGILRVSVPDIAKFVDAYTQLRSHRLPPTRFRRYGPGAAAISRVTQCDGHLSVWDAPTLVALLQELGFVDVTERDFGDSRIDGAIDNEARAWESCYVEAVK